MATEHATARREPVTAPRGYLVAFTFLVFLFQTLSILPETVGYGFALAGYAVIGGWFLASSPVEVCTDWRVVVALLLFLVLLVASVVRSPSVTGAVRLPMYVGLLLLNVLLLPAVLPREYFYAALARAGTLVTLVGLPAIVTGSFGPIPAYSGTISVFGTGVEFHPLTSFLSNPNATGFLLAVSFLSALWERADGPRRWTDLHASVCLGGTYLSGSRAALLLAAVGVAAVGVYRLYGHRAVMMVPLGVLGTAVGVVALAAGSLPFDTSFVGFNNRVELWTAAYTVFLDRPFLGWGLGHVNQVMIPYIEMGYLQGHDPHNSYLRVFAATGVGGGVTYLYLCGRGVIVHLSRLNSKAAAVEHGLLVGMLFVHLFQGATLLGVSHVSTIPAIVLGYAISQ